MNRQWTRVAGGLMALAWLFVWGLPVTGIAQGKPSQSRQLSAGDAGGTGAVLLQTSTTNHVIVELSVPDIQVDEVEVGGNRYIVLSAPGLEDAAAPGEPRLPQAGVLVGLPPAGGWSVQVLEMERQVIPLAGPVAPAASPAPFSVGTEAAPESLVPAWTADEAIYGDDAFFPSSPVEVGEDIVLRDLRAVRLGLRPLRYNAVQGELEHIRRLVVEVRFDTPTHGMLLPASDAWDPILGQAVINYDVAQRWRGVRPVVALSSLNPPAASPGSFKVQVDADGLYELTYERLEAEGFPVESVSPENLHLMMGGQEVAIQVELGQDGVFTRGDRILFYGQAAQGRYTDVNVYWLFGNQTPGLRMDSRPVAPLDTYPVPSAHWTATHFEENHRYEPLYPEPSGDHWYWDDLGFLQTDCPGAFWAKTFDLPRLWSGAHSVTLRATVQGYTFGTHNLAVWVNDRHVDDFVWDDLDRVDVELTFDAAWLSPSGNQLLLENGDCPPQPPSKRPPNGMYFNFFEVRHLAGHRAIGDELGREFLDFWGVAGNWQYELDGFATPNVLFDITDPTSPVALTGAAWTGSRLRFQDETLEVHRYLAAAQRAIRSPLAIHQDVPSNLTSTSERSDYLLIGYGEFLAVAQPLVELRKAQGLRVTPVDVQDVYDEFSFGRLDPGAIREFLAYVAAEWQDPPIYVLLLGDGTIDFRDYLGKGWHNFLPAYPADVDLREGPHPAETASDKKLDPGEVLPIFQMGRLPVSSVGQTQDVVAKIVNYETAPAPGLWNRSVLFAADDDDLAGPFTEFSDGIYQTLLEPLVGERVYLSKDPTEPYEYNANDPSGWEAARAVIRGRLGAGQLLAMYMGHSSYSQWAAEILLHRDYVPDLQNGGRLPIVLSMTCLTSAFHYYDYAPLDERLVVEPAGGAVAAWGATGAAVATGHRHLAEGFFDAIQGEGSETLGAATYAGMARLYTQAPTKRDLIDTYVLLGDPAMTINRFSGAVHSIYLPLTARAQ